MKERIYIQGMSCTACSSGIEAALKRKKGIEEIKVDLLNQRALLVFDEKLISLDEIFAFISKLGYQASKESLIEKIDKTFLNPKRRIILAGFFTLIALYLGMFGMFSPHLIPSFITPAASLFIQLFCSLCVMHLGRDFYLKGFKALFALHPTMDSLVALGSGSAFVFSLIMMLNGAHHELYFESVCVILFFVLVGKTIEEKAKKNTQNSLLSLIALKDHSVIRVFEGREELISIDEIRVGDILKITPQSLIPTEGIILEGYGNLDCSSLNGESLPIHKKKGESLYSGSLNLNTTFLMQVTQKARDSSYWKILDLVQNAIISKAPIAKTADKVAFYFVPFVILLALIAGVFWGIKDLSLGVQVFCSVLLISCPCALGLATPLALNIANNLAHKRGIFFKDAQILERIGKTEVIFFDKTGTLTQKELSLKTIISLSKLSQMQLLQICASLEQNSSHIIAQCLLKEAQRHSLALLPMQDILIKEGFGMVGRFEDKLYKIGNAKNFNPPPPSIDEASVFIGLQEKGGDKILGYLSLEENLKLEAKSSIAILKKWGITPILLSGDKQKNVQKIAQELETNFISDALPEDKKKAIQAYKPRITMMVGDGINDALALSYADISVSMGEGSQEAIASSNLVILNNHLHTLPYSIALSLATLKNIKQNLFWAFTYNMLMIPIACGALSGIGILLSPMFASLAMTLSSLSVVLNAQRLKRFKPKGVTDANTLF